MIAQSGEHVGEPGARIDIIELGGLDQRVNGRGAPPAFVRSCERPVVAAALRQTRRQLPRVHPARVDMSVRLHRAAHS
jgi:hypothetical protein